MHELAARLQLSEVQTVALIEEGKILAINVAPGSSRSHWRVPVESVERFEAGKSVIATPAKPAHATAPVSTSQHRQRMFLVSEIAVRWMASPKHISNLIGQGILRAVNIAPGSLRKNYRVPVEEIERFEGRPHACD